MNSTLSVFDLDHTLLNSNISFEFGRHLFRRGLISYLQLARLLLSYAAHKSTLISIEQLHTATFAAFFKGQSLALIQDEVKIFLNKNLPSLLYPPVANRLTSDSYILSSSPDFLVAPVAHLLGVSHWGATSYGIDKEGRLCEISEVMEGQAKARTLAKFAKEHNYKQEAIRFYTDSYLDSPVFDVAGLCIAVRPDKKLRKLANLKGWEIIDESKAKCAR